MDFKRLGRMRKNAVLRKMVRETDVTVNDLIYPLFIKEGIDSPVEIPSMPSIYQWPVDHIVKECEEIYDLGIGAVILFGIPEVKDENGSASYKENGIVQQALRQIKKDIPDLILIADVCLCEYTSHGHCGVFNDDKIDNDRTIEILAQSAVSFANAGADIVAPSDMMDGRVKIIRQALDEKGFINTPIMSYSAKYSSCFYAPFRDAAQCAPQFGDRKSYQMDTGNAREALIEIAADIEEGADIIMIKPALAYLDIIYRAREKFNIPIAAYNVSGEYAMIKSASRFGCGDEEKMMVEILTCIKRAGADLILTYFAKDMAKLLKR